MEEKSIRQSISTLELNALSTDYIDGNVLIELSTFNSSLGSISQITHSGIRKTSNIDYTEKRSIYNRTSSYREAMNGIQDNFISRVVDCNMKSQAPLFNDYEKTTCSRISDILRISLEMKATKTSFILVAVYLICWGPLGIYYFIDNCCSNCLSNKSHKYVSRLIVKVISFFSSIFLPLVYCWRTKQFQIETRKCICKRRQHKNIRTHRNNIGV